MRRRIVLSVDAPPEADDNDIANYIADALGSWGGSFRPPGAYGEDDDGDPLFDGLKCRIIWIGKVRYSCEGDS